MNKIFVYGTLKKGGKLSRNWPVDPVSIKNARVRASLYNMGWYPAIRSDPKSDDTVSGEVWEFREEDMDRVLQVIDRVEGYRDRDDDLYKRITVIAEYGEGADKVMAYEFANPIDETRFKKIEPVDGVATWSA